MKLLQVEAAQAVSPASSHALVTSEQSAFLPIAEKHQWVWKHPSHDVSFKSAWVFLCPGFFCVPGFLCLSVQGKRLPTVVQTTTPQL